MLNLLKQALKTQKRGLVFSGHGVAERFEDPEVESIHISKQNFTDIVDLLQELDFDFLSMEQLIAISNNGFKHDKHWTHLTFDDGYQNNFDVIYPLLKERRLPFSVFVSTHHVASEEKFYTFQVRAMLRERCSAEDFEQKSSWLNQQIKRMTVEQIERELHKLKSSCDWPAIEARYSNDKTIRVADLRTMAADPLVHIGSHNHHHVVMHHGLALEEMKAEIESSKAMLTQGWKISTEPTYCYPNGGVGDFSVRSVELTERHFPLSFVSLSAYVDSSTHPQMTPRFWLSNAKRTRAILGFSLLGNPGLSVLGRNPKEHFHTCRPTG